MRYIAAGLRLLLLAGIVMGAAQSAEAQKRINQTTALAGGITAGDAPGFPVTLSKRGSYRLIGNLTVPDATTTAIEITADDVTLDLNGFVISGPGTSGGSSPTGHGIFSVQSNITIVNGTVRGMGRLGIYLEGPGRSHRIENVQATANGASGILGFADSIVRNCTSVLNGTYGIYVYSGSTIAGNTASSNVFAGIRTFDGSTALGNTVRANQGFGLELGSTTGFAQNVATDNNGGNANPQVSGGIQMGPNVCGTALCP